MQGGWKRGRKVPVAENGIRVNDQVSPRGAVHIKAISTVTALTAWLDWLITKLCSNNNKVTKYFSARFLLLLWLLFIFLGWDSVIYHNTFQHLSIIIIFVWNSGVIFGTFKKKRWRRAKSNNNKLYLHFAFLFCLCAFSGLYHLVTHTQKKKISFVLNVDCIAVLQRPHLIFTTTSLLGVMRGQGHVSRVQLESRLKCSGKPHTAACNKKNNNVNMAFPLWQ